MSLSLLRETPVEEVGGLKSTFCFTEQKGFVAPLTTLKLLNTLEDFGEEVAVYFLYFLNEDDIRLTNLLTPAFRHKDPTNSAQGREGFDLEQVLHSALDSIRYEVECLKKRHMKQLVAPLLTRLEAMDSRAKSVFDGEFVYELAFDNLFLAHFCPELLETFVDQEAAQPMRDLLAAFRACFVASIFSTRSSVFNLIMTSLQIRHLIKIIRGGDSSPASSLSSSSLARLNDNATFFPKIVLSNLVASLQL
uniref:Uncharacterized protein n=1 Tax=Kwoniella dejecticola CBS 10117 TaxID=1296121 RepID=A0A1A6A0H7_9TREE|nr:uncharacterized protein I303_05818 [Kwoniella dejecticola CBS 10117]OBR83538.1 hypothetical protein I303_05818 [Kwoniella dejecticola CBS 10117]